MYKLGELIGIVEEVKDRCIQMEVVEFLRLKIARPCAAIVPPTLWLDVSDIIFRLWTEVESRMLKSMEETKTQGASVVGRCPLTISRMMNKFDGDSSGGKHDLQM